MKERIIWLVLSPDILKIGILKFNWRFSYCFVYTYFIKSSLYFEFVNPLKNWSTYIFIGDGRGSALSVKAVHEATPIIWESFM